MHAKVKTMEVFQAQSEILSRSFETDTFIEDLIAIRQSLVENGDAPAGFDPGDFLSKSNNLLIENAEIVKNKNEIHRMIKNANDKVSDLTRLSAILNPKNKQVFGRVFALNNAIDQDFRTLIQKVRDIPDLKDLQLVDDARTMEWYSRLGEDNDELLERVDNEDVMDIDEDEDVIAKLQSVLEQEKLQRFRSSMLIKALQTKVENLTRLNNVWSSRLTKLNGFLFKEMAEYREEIDQIAQEFDQHDELSEDDISENEEDMSENEEEYKEGQDKEGEEGEDKEVEEKDSFESDKHTGANTEGNEQDGGDKGEGDLHESASQETENPLLKENEQEEVEA